MATQEPDPMKISLLRPEELDVGGTADFLHAHQFKKLPSRRACLRQRLYPAISEL